MHKILACLVLLLVPLLADAADIQFNIGNVQVNNPPPARNFGDRDRRGYYWDGKTWRDPGYWNEHYGQEKAKGKAYHCPPGQAKKGNCAPPEPTPYR